jgi:hypothetical protein
MYLCAACLPEILATELWFKSSFLTRKIQNYTHLRVIFFSVCYHLFYTFHTTGNHLPYSFSVSFSLAIS